MDRERFIVITDMIKAGDHIVLTGMGQINNPYIISGVPEATDLIKAGNNVTFTGTGTADDPYVINAAGGGGTEFITGLIKAGENITFSGTGTAQDPYVVNTMPDFLTRIDNGDGIHFGGGGTVKDPLTINVILLSLLKPGTNMTRSGIGSVKSPMVLSADATGLISAGTNVTLTGTGTAVDPYVISAAGGGGPAEITGLIEEGENVVILGSGTAADPYEINAADPPELLAIAQAGDGIYFTGGGGSKRYPAIINSHIWGQIKAGTNVTITGQGSTESPYVISSTGGAATYLTAGEDIILTGTGTVADPYVITADVPTFTSGPGVQISEHGGLITYSARLADVLTAGTNVTVEGTGQKGSVMVVSANTKGLIKAGDNVTLTGSGTFSSPYVVNAEGPQRGEAWAIDYADDDMFEDDEYSMVAKNADGTVSLAGGFKTVDYLHSYWEADKEILIATLPTGYAPSAPNAWFPAFMRLTDEESGLPSGGGVIGIHIDYKGNLYIHPPVVVPGLSRVAISLDGIRYEVDPWPN